MIETRLQLYCAGELRNLGDALIAETLVRRFRKDGFSCIEVLSWREPSAEMKEHFAAAGALAIGLEGRVWTNLRAAAGARVVLAGGNAVRDTVGLRWLLHLLAVVAIATLTGGAAHALGVGVAAARKHRWKRGVWDWLLRAMDTISVRDAGSLERLHLHWPAVAARARLSADVVYGREEWPAAVTPAGMAARVLVAPASDAMESRQIQSERWAALAVDLAHLHGASEILVLAHDVELDRAVCERLTAQIGRDGRIPVRQIDLPTPALLDSIYRPGTLVLSSRLHALILGTMAAAPVIVVSDGDTKIVPFAEACGAPIVCLAAGDDPDVGAAYANAVRSVSCGRQARSVSHMRRLALSDGLSIRQAPSERVQDAAQP